VDRQRKPTDWSEVPGPVRDEILRQVLDLLASCEHDWSEWQWVPADAKHGWARQCAICQTWVYDLPTNVI
jgi:hypothetical protein